MLDIGPSSSEKLVDVSIGHLFVIGETGLCHGSDRCSESYTSLLKKLYKKQLAKTERHNAQSGTASGINYN